jgi:hypothetical protein
MGDCETVGISGPEGVTPPSCEAHLHLQHPRTGRPDDSPMLFVIKTSERQLSVLRLSFAFYMRPLVRLS